jgi:hypothetical protein
MIFDDWFVWTWLVLCLISTAYVFVDNFVRGNPEMAVTRARKVAAALPHPSSHDQRTTSKRTAPADSR